MRRGFTLIETVIYIALLGLIMSTMLLSVYQILQSETSTGNKTTLQEESAFVLRKIDFALTGISATPGVAGSGCTQTLHTVKYDGTTDDVRININGSASAIEMRENSLSYLPITTPNVSATCLKFQPITVGTLSGVTATVTIGGVDFTTTKFLRK